MVNPKAAGKVNKRNIDSSGVINRGDSCAWIKAMKIKRAFSPDWGNGEGINAVLEWKLCITLWISNLTNNGNS